MMPGDILRHGAFSVGRGRWTRCDDISRNTWRKDFERSLQSNVSVTVLKVSGDTGRRRSLTVVGDLMNFKNFGNKVSDMTICEVFDSAVLPLRHVTNGIVTSLREGRPCVYVILWVPGLVVMKESFRFNIATNRVHPSRRSNCKCD